LVCGDVQGNFDLVYNRINKLLKKGNLFDVSNTYNFFHLLFFVCYQFGQGGCLACSLLNSVLIRMSPELTRKATFVSTASLWLNSEFSNVHMQKCGKTILLYIKQNSQAEVPKWGVMMSWCVILRCKDVEGLYPSSLLRS